MGNKKDRPEVFISFDAEFDGKIPGDYSMLSLGAVAVDAPEHEFYIEIKPISPAGDPETVEFLKNVGLDREKLISSGTDPLIAMQNLNAWTKMTCRKIAGSSFRPVFVG